MHHDAGHLALTAESRVLFRVSPRGFFVGTNCTGTGFFLKALRRFSVSIITPVSNAHVNFNTNLIGKTGGEADLQICV